MDICCRQGCGRVVKYKNLTLCQLHYQRYRRDGDYGPPDTLTRENLPSLVENRKLILEKLLRCTKCKNILSLKMFTSEKNRLGGLSTWCKNCVRNKRLMGQYGITLEQYNKISLLQYGRCAICQDNEEQRIKRNKSSLSTLFVDHCHKKGRVRALVCGPCNQAIGLIKDNPQIALDLYHYLTKHQ